MAAFEPSVHENTHDKLDNLISLWILGGRA